MMTQRLENLGGAGVWSVLAVVICLMGGMSADTRAQVARSVQTPPRDQRTALYVSNRDPLLPNPFVKLPIGSITPKGWLRDQLVLEKDGMVGHLTEISQWCKYEGNAWVVPEGTGHSGWEELPYWLKGYGDLGYVLKDQKIIDETKKWIEAVFKLQREDGYFGPRSSLTSLEGKPDLWPNMLMLNVMQAYYEYSDDERVIPFMTRYFKWQMTVPEEDFLVGYWPKIRGGDNLESIYWLYNRTGDKWLLELAEKVHRRTADWTSGVINWHGVNITQGFREPGVYYMQAKDAKFIQAAERNYQTVMGLYGQMPGGMFGADENARKGYDDPRQGAETCSMVEFMHSFEMLTKITGEALWGDRCEEVAFNSLPAALTPDLKGLHYLTGANQIQLDKENKSPGVQNGGTMFSYSPYAVYRCCQHNVSHGWPFYAEELWLATADKGLCASLYGASEVQAKVGDGAMVKITEETDYPFGDTITLKFSTQRPVQFPLYLRLPKWCEQPQWAINGSEGPAKGTVQAAGSAYLVVKRAWKEGDTVTLRLPMKVAVRRWEKNKGAASVDYGPLSFALEIGERWRKYGGTDQWPEMEVLPTTAWNYGLVLDEKDPATSFEVVKKEGPLASQPFTAETAPIKLRAKAKKIPGWKQEASGLVARLQQSPVKSSQPVETITLIPMGAARLRISAFPVIGEGGDAHEWAAASAEVTPTASHVFASDTVEALNDGISPANSADQNIARFTWWDHRGTQEWVQYDFNKPRRVSATEVYWFDDTGVGQCRLPMGWKMLYRAGDEWKELTAAGAYGVERDRFNRVEFQPVQTDGVRLVVQLRPEFSGGILEWKVE